MGGATVRCQEVKTRLPDPDQLRARAQRLDIYVLLKAAGQVETALGIAAHTLFEPRAERSQG
jgi:hypothetical protein